MDIISSEVLFAPAPLVRADARPRTPCTSLTRAVVRPTARLHLRDASCSVVRRLRAPVACGCRRQLQSPRTGRLRLPPPAALQQLPCGLHQLPCGSLPAHCSSSRARHGSCCSAPSGQAKRVQYQSAAR